MANDIGLIIAEEIKHTGCYIVSVDTLRTEDLLSAAYMLLKNTNANEALQTEIASVFTNEPTDKNIFHNQAQIIEGKEEAAAEILNDTVYGYFMEIAPGGAYFGSHPGDGACIGFFKDEEDEDE